ncbi:class III extradiol ring-cleavage dioxygenase [Agaribacterium sp. ZY112]|uniref:DODA-type extradiol aromatic ring-opening family dioxygenase n=1 Tax=Agaribacterium sp. ZY112 TaxID=3233574 RepID=UPI0035239D21
MIASSFISHGPPDRLLYNSPAKQFLEKFPNLLTKKAKAIVVISAHWQSRELCISQTGKLDSQHDFWGFPKDLYNFSYQSEQPAWLSDAINKSLNTHSLKAKPVSYKLDHGIWSVLKLAYPNQQIPLAALSLPQVNDLKKLYELGQALSDLRQQGVLILASGSATHNLRALSLSGQTPLWAKHFVTWLQRCVAEWDIDQLCQPYKYCEHAQLAHPSLEHYAPLLIAMGAAKKSSTRLIHESWEYGSLNNSSWLFE